MLALKNRLKTKLETYICISTFYLNPLLNNSDSMTNLSIKKKKINEENRPHIVYKKGASFGKSQRLNFGKAKQKARKSYCHLPACKEMRLFA